MKSSHDFSTLKDIDATAPILVICVIILMIRMSHRLCPKFIKKQGYDIGQTLDVDEDLPDFFSTLKLKDKEWFVKEN